jgi:S-adenosylmethionine-diacylglycerol 3-amino-3-carboxypropyl transferase
MNELTILLRRLEFEYRIFISLGIVAIVYAASSLFFPHVSSNFILIGELVGNAASLASAIGFLFCAIVLVFCSLLRMWAGSILSSRRVMSFKVQVNTLLVEGPYHVVRNPIYFADFIAMCVFALCLPPIGLLIPLLFFFHYTQLIQYEEEMFYKEHTDEYKSFLQDVPRLFPTVRSLKNLHIALSEFKVNRDGIRHNALYTLFIVGFIVAAFTEEFSFAVLIGIPAVIDWAVVHTKIGVSRGGSKRKKVFENVLYAQCWEDPSLDREAFNITEEDVVFSITSGGCNVLTFLIDNPAKVIALDINQSQNHLLQLKIEGFRVLSYEELLEFLGVEESNRRLELYERIRNFISNNAHDYWDSHRQDIARGIIHCGRYEKYMRLLRTFLTKIIGEETVKIFFETEVPEERKKLYEHRWDVLLWKFFTRIMLSRTVMSLLFDNAFFAQLERRFSFGKHFEQKVKRALTELPIKENYFLSYILSGRYYSQDHLPPYLRREHFELIRSRLNRITIITDSCEHYFQSLPDNSISKFNFTNIFEWMPLNSFKELLKETIRVAKEGAILTYRNLLVPRERPQPFSHRILQHRNLAQRLHQRDLSFIYSNYVVEEIRKEEVLCHTELRRSVLVEK